MERQRMEFIRGYVKVAHNGFGSSVVIIEIHDSPALLADLVYVDPTP
jgi:hypothetical protein